MNNPFLGMTAIEKIGSIMYTLGKYVALMFWPHPLSHDYYPYAIPKASLFTLLPLLSSFLFITLLFTGFRGWVKKSVYSYSILYYLVTLTIVSNIVINLGTFMNERFIFMASAGFCIAAAYFISVHLPRLLPSEVGRSPDDFAYRNSDRIRCEDLCPGAGVERCSITQ